MAVTADKSAPYAPISAILEIIKRVRNFGLSKPLNSDILRRIGVTDSLIPRTLQALRILDLINKDGTATDTFEGIRKAPEAEYKERLENWLKESYADVFLYVDPSDDDEIKVRDAFRSYKPHGQQDRMVALFLGLCVEADIAKKSKRKQKTRVVSAVGKSSGSSKVKGKASQRQSFADDGLIPPPIAGLLQSLPSESEGWTSDRREEFIKIFGTVLDFCIPVQNNRPSEQNNEPDTE